MRHFARPGLDPRQVSYRPVVLLCLCLVVAACDRSGSGDAAGTAADRSAAAAASAPAEPAPPPIPAVEPGPAGGIDATRVIVRAVLPGGAGSATARAVLEGYFDDINRAGGVRDRRLELQDDAAPAANAFVLLAPRGAEAAALDLSNDVSVPLIGAFAPGTLASTRSGLAYYIYAGLDARARALAEHAMLRDPERPIGVVYPDAGAPGEAARAAIDQVSRHSAAVALEHAYPAGTLLSEAAAGVASMIRGQQVVAVLFFGNGAEFRALALALAGLEWTPDIYLDGALTGGAVLDSPAVFDRQLWVAFPTSAGDHTSTGVFAWNDLRERHGLSRQALPIQLDAFITARLLVHALRRSGPQPGRADLVAALNRLDDYRSELSPPLSFSDSRRIGAIGAHILAVDLAKRGFHPESTWIDVGQTAARQTVAQ